MTDLQQFRPFQFSIRWILLATAVLAVFLGLTAPRLRMLPSREVSIILSVWFVVFVIVAGMLWLLAWLYQWKCHQFGTPLCVLPFRWLRWIWVFHLFLVLTWLVGTWFSWQILFGGRDVSRDPRLIFDEVWSIVHISILVVEPTLQFFLFEAWLLICNRAIVLTEHGFVHSFRQTTWSEIVRDEWHPETEELWIVKRFDTTQPLRFRVRAEHHDVVEAVLRQVRPKYHGAEQAPESLGENT